jgi:membrane protease subunit HflC
MNLRKFMAALIGVGLFFLLLVLLGAFFTVGETEQVILTQFGEPVREPINRAGVDKDGKPRPNEAGVHFKVPFIQTVHRFEKRVLDWDGPASKIQTKEKQFINVDTFARWRISDPLTFFRRLGDERRALSRLDDIIGSETRNTIARHNLVELIRTTKARQPAQDEALTGGGATPVTTFAPIQSGRVVLEREVSEQSKTKLEEFGIELLDVRFMRVNYDSSVANKIYDRMTSERKQIAERFRSEGAGEAAKILGTRERDIKQIESEAYQKTQAIQGKADAEAIRIYAEAFNQTPEAREFYEFQRSLETYKTTLQRDTTVVLSTENGFLRHLKGEPLKPKAPVGAGAQRPPRPENSPPPVEAAPPAPPKPANAQ